MFKTRKLVFVALLGSLAFLLMLLNFPLLPGADFLKVDLSILPILVALTLFDTKAAYAVLVVRTVLKLLLDNGGIAGIIGLPMNVVAVAVFVWCFAVFWQQQRTWSRFILASLVGTLALTLAMLLLNCLYAVPVYARFAFFDIREIIGLQTYLWGMVLPFNLIEGLLFSLSFGLFWLPMKSIIERYRQ